MEIPEEPPQAVPRSWLLSLSASITPLAAIVASAITVTVPLAEAVRGWFELKLNAADHEQQISVEFLKLVIGKDVSDDDRRHVLELLERSGNQPQLADWAKAQLKKLDAEADMRRKQLEHLDAAIKTEDAAKRDYGIAEANAESAEQDLKDAIDHGEGADTINRLRSAMLTARQAAQQKAAALSQTQSQAKALAEMISLAAELFAQPQAATRVASTAHHAPEHGATTQQAHVVTPETVAKLFPGTQLSEIQKDLPHLLSALAERGLADKTMLLLALATIRADLGTYVSLSEAQSLYNTLPGGAPFGLYEPGTPTGLHLGNIQPGDGERFRGRGYVLLTGRANYARLGKQIGVDLEALPEKAAEPATAARILAQFLKNNEAALRTAVSGGDLKRARRLVDGGLSGLDNFSEVMKTGEKLFADDVTIAAAD